MIKLNEQEIYLKLAKKHKMSSKQIEYIVNRMWGDVRRFMREPSTTKKGILLTGFGKFYINPNKVQEYLDSKAKYGFSEKDQELIRTIKMLTDG